MPGRLTTRLIADEGAVVHFNGIEAIRDNMPSGPLTASSLAPTNRSGAAESQFRRFEVDPSGLVIGDNLVAIEVHRDQARSSDLSMDADVIGTYSN